MEPNYWTDKDRKVQLFNTTLTLSFSRPHNDTILFHYNGIFKEGILGFGKWWKLSFAAQGLQVTNLRPQETMESLIKSFSKFKLEIYPTGFFDFSYLYNDYNLIEIESEEPFLNKETKKYINTYWYSKSMVIRLMKFTP